VATLGESVDITRKRGAHPYAELLDGVTEEGKQRLYISESSHPKITGGRKNAVTPNGRRGSETETGPHVSKLGPQKRGMAQKRARSEGVLAALYKDQGTREASTTNCRKKSTTGKSKHHSAND